MTYFVGGSADNGETAVPNFVDDVDLGHTPFATVEKDGVLYQLNQNGDREDPVSLSISGQNKSQYERGSSQATSARTRRLPASRCSSTITGRASLRRLHLLQGPDRSPRRTAA